MPIVYKKGSLFDAPPGSVLVHACNAQGVWGSGIAKQFVDHFPKSYEFYKDECKYIAKQEMGRTFGNVIICPKENDRIVAGLITSWNYGKNKDSKIKILENTRIALQSLLSGCNNKLYVYKDREIHSCKFNSGLFGVEWSETERVLLEVMAEACYDKEWTVWEQ
jgi:ADP-ribose 1''-phosphate phosphatase